LENAAADALVRFDRCLVIDVHSFSSMPLPHEPDQTVPRPELCIGFDQFHSPFLTIPQRFGAYARRTGLASASTDRPLTKKMI
jgi:hypothetical protein